MIFTAMRMLGPPKPRGIPASQVKPVNAGIVARTTIVAFLGAVVISFYANGYIPGWLTAGCILMGLVALGGIFGTAIGDAARERQRLSSMRFGQNAPLRITSLELRNRAGELTPDTTVVTGRHRAPAAGPYEGTHRAPYEARHRVTTAPPAARTATLAPECPATPHLDKLKLRAGEDARLYRVAAILVTSCPFCGAGESEPCIPVTSSKWYELDRARGLYAHSLRIVKALATDSAGLDDVRAQFNGQLPDEIMRSML